MTACCHPVASGRRDRARYYLESGGPSSWWGLGAQELGLVGPVDADDLYDIWEGCDPDDGNLLVRQGTRGKHDSSIDVTFSPPKSLSIIWSVALTADPGMATRIEQAHSRAVETALRYLERECSLVRRRIGGKVCHEPSGGLVVSRFRDYTSRMTHDQQAQHLSPDPQLHDHCVVSNLALRRDGQKDHYGRRWGCIDGMPLMRMVRRAGQVYDIAVRRETELLGYATFVTDTAWEIVGVSRQNIEDNSDRDREIRHAMQRFTAERKREPTASERWKLVLLTRAGKGSDNPADHAAKWAIKNRKAFDRATRQIGIIPQRNSPKENNPVAYQATSIGHPDIKPRLSAVDVAALLRPPPKWREPRMASGGRRPKRQSTQGRQKRHSRDR